jgi:hypothetical protein
MRMSDGDAIKETPEGDLERWPCLANRSLNDSAWVVFECEYCSVSDARNLRGGHYLEEGLVLVFKGAVRLERVARLHVATMKAS